MSDNTEFQSIDETARRRFEQAKRQGINQDLASFLPDPQDSRYQATLEELVFLELEWTWKRFQRESAESPERAQQPATIEQFVSEFPRLDDPPIVLRLARHEYYVRHKYGDQPSSQIYCQRFPSAVKSSDQIEGKESDQHVSRKFSTGQLVERYRLTDAHATGGFGVVWRATDERLGRPVALKHLRDRVADDEGVRSRFVNEARITARLEHPGIVPIYDIGSGAQECPFYTMKFVRGRTLEEVIRQHHQPTSDADGHSIGFLRLINIFLAVARTMQYAHAQDVVHRDLKPQNIIVGDYGETIILDWGLACPANRSKHGDASQLSFAWSGTADRIDQTAPGAIQGTPAYMSPEQAAGRNEDVDSRSDVYSLGAILYQILTGKLPFANSDRDELLEKLQHSTPPKPRTINTEIPKPIEAICCKALERTPEDRYEDVAQLVADIERYLADERVEAWREPIYAPVGRWMRRHKTLMTGVSAATVVLLLAMIAGVSLLTIANGRERHLRDIADGERKEALHNFQLARGSVDQYLNLVTDDDRLRTAALEPLRRELLLHAKSFYAQLAKKKPNDQKLRLEHAAAHGRLASISRELGRYEESTTASREAIALLEGLLGENPNDRKVSNELQGIRMDLGIMFKQMGEFKKAQPEYAEAIRMARQSLKKWPEDETLGISLAKTLINFGSMCVGQSQNSDEATDQLARAEEAFQEAIGHCTTLEQNKQLADIPRFKVRNLLAAAYSNLSLVQNDVKKHQDAEASARRSIELREQLLQDSPQSELVMRGLAMAHVNLSAGYHDREQWTDSLESNQRAKRLFAQLIRRRPDLPRYRYLLSSAAFNSAQALRYAGQNEQAIPEYQDALAAVAPLAAMQPNSLTYQRHLADTARQLGSALASRERNDEAMDAYRTAAKASEAMLDRAPEMRSSLLLCQLNLGKLLWRKPDLSKAAEAFRSAIDVIDKSPDSSDQIAADQLNLSTALLNLGQVELQLDQDAQAEQHLRRAESILEHEVDKHPNEFALLDNLINTRENLGRALHFGKKKDTPAALQIWKKAFAVHGPVLERWPEKVELHLAVAKLHGMSARGFTKQNNHREASRQYDSQLLILRKMLEQPGVNTADIRDNILDSLSQQALRHQSLNEFSRAAVLFDEAIRLAEELSEQELMTTGAKAEKRRDQLARIWFSLSTVHKSAGDGAQAKSALQACKETFSALAADFPNKKLYSDAVETLSKQLKTLDQPKSAKDKPGESKTAQPKTAQPKTAQPKIAQPKASQPKANRPEAKNPK